VLDDPVVKRASLVGELDGAAGAVDQPRAEARFQLRDRSADSGLRDAGTKLGACLAGFGIAQVIDLGLEHHFKSGALINLFPDWPDERFPLYVYYASRNYVPAKVRKFIDFIAESLGTEVGTASKRKPGAKGDAMAALETTVSD
jgi:DNA-binding transcriptional LysR family regulator